MHTHSQPARAKYTRSEPATVTVLTHEQRESKSTSRKWKLDFICLCSLPHSHSHSLLFLSPSPCRSHQYTSALIHMFASQNSIRYLFTNTPFELFCVRWNGVRRNFTIRSPFIHTCTVWIDVQVCVKPKTNSNAKLNAPTQPPVYMYTHRVEWMKMRTYSFHMDRKWWIECSYYWKKFFFIFRFEMCARALL